MGNDNHQKGEDLFVLAIHQVQVSGNELLIPISKREWFKQEASPSTLYYFAFLVSSFPFQRSGKV